MIADTADTMPGHHVTTSTAESKDKKHLTDTISYISMLLHLITCIVSGYLLQSNYDAFNT